MPHPNKRILIYLSFEEEIEDEEVFMQDLEEAIDEVVSSHGGEVSLIKNGTVVEGGADG